MQSLLRERFEAMQTKLRESLMSVRKVTIRLDGWTKKGSLQRFWVSLLASLIPSLTNHSMSFFP